MDNMDRNKAYRLIKKSLYYSTLLLHGQLKTLQIMSLLNKFDFCGQDFMFWCQELVIHMSTLVHTSICLSKLLILCFLIKWE